MVGTYTSQVKFCIYANVEICSKFCLMKLITQCAPSLSVGGRRVEPPTKFSKREGLPGPQILEEACWERGE